MLSDPRLAELPHALAVRAARLVVDEALRGKGWGRYLLQRTLWEAQTQGFRECVLCTSEGNYTARLLYASLGFVAVESLVKLRKTVVAPTR